MTDNHKQIDNVIAKVVDVVHTKTAPQLYLEVMERIWRLARQKPLEEITEADIIAMTNEALIEMGMRGKRGEKK
jgi:hypothetical protein